VQQGADLLVPHRPSTSPVAVALAVTVVVSVPQSLLPCDRDWDYGNYIGHGHGQGHGHGWLSSDLWVMARAGRPALHIDDEGGMEMKNRSNTLSKLYRNACTRLFLLAENNASMLMMLIGIGLLSGGLVDLSAAQCAGPLGSCSEAGLVDDLIRSAVGNLFRLIEGAFGALIMVVSGIGAIVAASMGAYRAAVGMLVVAIGAFILRSLVSLFFGTDFPDYEA
jgi:hypothetical protein